MSGPGGKGRSFTLPCAPPEQLRPGRLSLWPDMAGWRGVQMPGALGLLVSDACQPFLRLSAFHQEEYGEDGAAEQEASGGHVDALVVIPGRRATADLCAYALRNSILCSWEAQSQKDAILSGQGR